MAELFDAEQYRQQMSGQQPAPQQGYPQAMQTQPGPQAYQPQDWAPQHHQPQLPVHQMPPAPVFAPPPSAGIEGIDEAPKTSRFKRKRAAKVKTPKVKKTKGEAAEVTHPTQTSPAMIFMFGMATGIVCFLVGNMLMSNLLSDNSAKSFQDIERQNAQAQQPVSPKSAQNTEG